MKSLDSINLTIDRDDRNRSLACREQHNCQDIMFRMGYYATESGYYR